MRLRDGLSREAGARGDGEANLDNETPAGSSTPFSCCLASRLCLSLSRARRLLSAMRSRSAPVSCRDPEDDGVLSCFARAASLVSLRGVACCFLAGEGLAEKYECSVRMALVFLTPFLVIPAQSRDADAPEQSTFARDFGGSVFLSELFALFG